MTAHSSSTPAASSDVWTTRRLLDWMAGYLTERHVDDARLTTELLLAHVLRCQRLRLFMEVERPASRDELARLREMVKRIGAYEPVQYVLGEGWFYGRPFEVNRSTLIPRPCTETLVEHVIWHVRKSSGSAGVLPAWSMLDIGTGTGCIAITIAKEIPSTRIVATDIRDDILALARRNVARHEVNDRIDFRRGTLFDPLRPDEDCFDVICANPPYIPDHEWPDVPRNVKEHEPHSALRGGPDGLDVIGPLISQSIQFLSAAGLLAIEIATVQRDEVIRLAKDAGFASADVVKDHEQKWRVLLARR